LVFAAAVWAAEDEKKDEPEKPKTHVEEWIQLGPFPAPFPAFNDEDDEQKMKAGDVLAYEHLELADPWPVVLGLVAVLPGLLTALGRQPAKRVELGASLVLLVCFLVCGTVAWGVSWSP